MHRERNEKRRYVWLPLILNFCLDNIWDIPSNWVNRHWSFPHQVPERERRYKIWDTNNQTPTMLKHISIGSKPDHAKSDYVFIVWSSMCLKQITLMHWRWAICEQTEHSMSEKVLGSDSSNSPSLHMAHRAVFGKAGWRKRNKCNLDWK